MARKPSTVVVMPDAPVMVIVPATSDRWPDVAELPGGDGERGCWCQAWRGRDEVARVTGESRSATMRRQVVGEPPSVAKRGQPGPAIP